MNDLELAAFIKSASNNCDVSEDEAREIMIEDDDMAYMRYGMKYSIVRDAANVWKDAVTFARRSDDA
jgi:hypothetical protein